MDKPRPEGLTDPGAELVNKKDELRRAVRSFDPLAPLRRHPYVTVGMAAALGITVGSEAATETAQLAVKAPIKQKLMGFAIKQAIRLVTPRPGNSESQQCPD